MSLSISAKESRRGKESSAIQGVHDRSITELFLVVQVQGWKVQENVYSGKRWMPPARAVGVWGGVI